jgi:hypothetical protein
MSEPSKKDQLDSRSNPLNRRKAENRWQRILRDADWDQHETVRRWLRLAREVFGEEKKKEQEEQPEEHSRQDAA